MIMSYASNMTRRNFLRTLGLGTLGVAAGAYLPKRLYAGGDGPTENKYILGGLSEICGTMEKNGQKELSIDGINLNADTKPDNIKVTRRRTFRPVLGNYDREVDVFQVDFNFKDMGKATVSAEVSAGKFKDVYVQSSVDEDIIKYLEIWRKSGKFPK